MFIKLQVVGGNVTRFAVEGILTYWASHDGTNRIITRDCDVGAGEQYTIKETPEETDALIEAEKRKELRDEFAGRVVVGIMRTCDEIHGTVVSRDDIAMEAYRMADAMLKAREG